MARLILALALMAAPALAAPPKPAPVVQAAPAVPLAPSVKNGVELWRAGDYAGAVAIWQPYANAGDADAMFNIGQAYKLGRAVPKDPVAARDWYRKAALKGHLPAQANLGILLFQAGEKAEAVRWLKAAADKNEMRAQYVLGVATWNGDSVPRSMTLAYGYLARASAQGLPEATTALNNLNGAILPVERANGLAVAGSLASGNGVPAVFAPNAGRALASTDSLNRDQVMKPAPRASVVATPPASYALPVPKPPAIDVATAVAPMTSPPVVSSIVPKPVPVTPPAMVAIVAPRPVVVTPPVVVASTAVPRSVPVVVTPKPEPSPTVTVRPVAPAVTSVAIPGSTPVAPPAPASKPIEIAVAPPKPVEAAVAAPKPVVRAAPKPVVVAEAKPVPKVAPKPTGWRIQLGAFSKKALAEAAWSDVKIKQKQLVGSQKPIYEADGGVTKLQMGPYTTKVAARDACAKIAFTGRACFVTEG